MKNKNISCLLLIAMLAGSLLSCGDTTTTEDTTPVTDTTVSTETATDTETERILPDLPEQDFEGYTFRGLVRGYVSTHWYTRDFYADEMTGETINDAVYTRNATLGERYNFEMEQLDGVSLGMEGYVRKTVQAGEDAMDIVIGTCGLSSLVTEGYLVDLTTVPHIDLTKPWYDQNANDSLSISHKLFTTVSDLTVMDKDATWCILFNKPITNDLGLGDFYEMVKEGKWTMDVMLSAMEAASIDLDGDGSMGAADQWGNTGEQFNVMGYMVGGGAHCFTKDENDLPVVDVLSDRYIAAYEMAHLLNDSPNLCMHAGRFNNDWDLIDAAFTEGRALFTFVGMNRVTLFREMEMDFGILPAPKYDESQERYYDVVSSGNATFVSIPKSVSDLDRTGFITEALAAESLYTLTPAYYDITLKTKMARDVESAAMLDIIFDSRVFELGNFYGWGGIYDIPGNQSFAGKTEIVSAVEGKIASTESAMQKTIDAVLKNAQ